MRTYFLHPVKSITVLVFGFAFIYCIYLFCKHKYLQIYSDATPFINTRLCTSLPGEDYHGASWFGNKRCIFWYNPAYIGTRTWTRKVGGEDFPLAALNTSPVQPAETACQMITHSILKFSWIACEKNTSSDFLPPCALKSCVTKYCSKKP